MGFNKIRLGIEEIFTLIIQDESGKVIEKWTMLKRDFNRTLRILDNKYGLNIWKKKENKDLDWAIK